MYQLKPLIINFHNHTQKNLTNMHKSKLTIESVTMPNIHYSVQLNINLPKMYTKITTHFIKI